MREALSGRRSIDVFWANPTQPPEALMFDAHSDPVSSVRSLLAAVAQCAEPPVLLGAVYVHALQAPDDDVAAAPILHIAEALESGLVLVRELETPDVGRLKFEHTGGPGSTAVFVPAGTLVRGGGQNRIVSVSSLLSPGESRPIEVRCVEAGRWNPTTSRAFTETGSAPQSLRSRKLTRDSCARLASGSSRASDQSETWNDVTTHLRRVSVQSRTESLFDAVDRMVPSRRPIPDALADKPGAWIEGETTGGEVFVAAGLRRAGMRGLVDSANAEVSGALRPPLGFADARDDLLASADWRATTTSGGVIVDARGPRSGAVATAFVVQGRVIHLAMAMG